MSDMGSDGTSSLQSDTGNQRSMKNALVNQDKVQFSFDDVGNQQQKTNDVEFKVDSDELVKKISGICKRCKALKVRCEFLDSNSCRRCTTGGHECIPHVKKKSRPDPERESLLHQIDEQKIQIKALREELALRKDKARSRSEPWSPSAQLRHTVSELFVENLDRFERGPEGLDNTAPPKAVDATGVEKIHQAACIECKKLKVKCEYNVDENDCRRCLDNGQVCVIRSRRKHGPPLSRRERLLNTVREQETEIRELTQKLGAREDIVATLACTSRSSPPSTTSAYLVIHPTSHEGHSMGE